MSKDVQEAHNSIPQPAVGQRLLVTGTGTLTDTETQSQMPHSSAVTILGDVREAWGQRVPAIQGNRM